MSSVAGRGVLQQPDGNAAAPGHGAVHRQRGVAAQQQQLPSCRVPLLSRRLTLLLLVVGGGAATAGGL